MEWKEYQKAASRTLARTGSKMNNNLHMTLGIITELTEYTVARDNNDVSNEKEELGDLYWYVANWFTINKFEGKAIPGSLSMPILIGDLCDMYKKELAYNKKANSDRCYGIMCNILYRLHNACIKNEYSIQDILQTNIDKLKVRYPEKFTTEKALNRDLSAEAKVL